jgi:hypothetical protein
MALLSPDIPTLEDDLGRLLEGVDQRSAGAGVRVWEAFLDHAAQPIAFEEPPDHPDNDKLGFTVYTAESSPGLIGVLIERRIGLETADEGYIGTIVAAYYLTVARTGAWAPVRIPFSVEGYGVSSGEPGALDAFRGEVEASDAFAALRVCEIERVQISVGDA